MKNRAFTLMEMIAVITILGVILLIVTPQLSKMVINNKDDEHITFVKLVEKAAYTYADFKPDGNYDVSLFDLKNSEYIKEIDKYIDNPNQKIIIIKSNGKITINEIKIKFKDGKSCTTKQCGAS